AAGVSCRHIDERSSNSTATTSPESRRSRGRRRISWGEIPMRITIGDGEGCVASRPGLATREREWGRRLAGWMLGWLGFETITGLSIYLLPFSVPNEWIVLVHTLIGLLFLVPSFVYQLRHLAVYWSRPSSAVKWMGYLGSGATLAAVISGLVLTAEAL